MLASQPPIAFGLRFILKKAFASSWTNASFYEIFLERFLEEVSVVAYLNAISLEGKICTSFCNFEFTKKMLIRCTGVLINVAKAETPDACLEICQSDPL